MQVHSLIHSAFPIIVIVRDFASVCPCNWVNMGGHGANLLGHIVFFCKRGVSSPGGLILWIQSFLDELKFCQVDKIVGGW